MLPPSRSCREGSQGGAVVDEAEPTEDALANRRVLVVGSFDSFLKAATRYAVALSAAGAEVEYVVAHVREGQLSDRQRAQLGLPADTPERPVGDLCNPGYLANYDVILLAMDGLRTRQFMLGFERLCHGRSRPITVALYPGLVFRFALEGMVSRMSCDLFLLNSEHDYQQYRKLQRAVAMERDNGLAAGLAVLDRPVSAEASSVRSREAERRTVLFVGQPTVPAGRHEREYVVYRLMQLAERYSQFQFVIKPRHRPEEQTLHRLRYHYEDLLRAARRKRGDAGPSNLSVAYEPMDELIERCRLCLSFSSTAVLECAAKGIPARSITDLGVHENLGNNFFVDSGLLASFDDVEPNLPNCLDKGWAARHAIPAANQHAEVLRRILALLAEQEELGRALPLPSRSFCGLAPSYVEFIEQQHGRAMLAQFGDPNQGRRRRWYNRLQRVRRWLS